MNIVVSELLRLLSADDMSHTMARRPIVLVVDVVNQPNSHPSSALARIGVANPVVQHADRSFTPMRSSWVHSKPTAAAASVQPHQLQPRG